MSRKVLLVGWDAADWKIAHPLVQAGAMPNLARLMREGVSGNLATLHPPLSPMLWTSIATGKRPHKHGIMGFSEVTPDGKSIRPITIQARKTKAIWNILSQTGKKSVVVGWWPSHPAEPINGAIVSDWFRDTEHEAVHQRPVSPGSVHPPELASQIRDLRVSPYEVDGAMLRAFVPDFDKVDQQKDKSLHSLAKIICEGMTINAVATDLLATQEWDFAAVYFDAIDHFGHRFMAYHPPHTTRADAEIAELYRHVVANAYAWHDAMLGELMATAGDDTTVILMSDHGFHSDHLRPQYIPAEGAGPAVEHRHFGMLAMVGPGIKHSGGSVYGALLTDICPTILRLFDLPAAKDMDGKVLIDALEKLEPLPAIESWETVEGPHPDGRHAKESVFDPGEAAELYKRLQDLGYVDPLDDDMEKNIASTLSELRYNEARALLEARETGPAIELLQRLTAEAPEDIRFVDHLVNAHLANDDWQAARKVIETFLEKLEKAVPEAIEKLKSLTESYDCRFNELLERWRDRENSADNEPDAAPVTDQVESPEAGQLSKDEMKKRQHKAFLDFLKQAATEDEARQLLHEEPELRKTNTEIRRLNELATGYPMQTALMRVRSLLHPSADRTAETDQEAHDVLLKIENLRGDAVRGSVELANHWLQLKNFDKAEQICHASLEIDPEEPRALAILAESAWRQGQVARAIEAASDSIALLWFQPGLHLLIGLGLERLGEPEKAARMLESAIGMAPMLVRAHAALGRIYAKPPLNQPVLANRHRETAEKLRAGILEKKADWTKSVDQLLDEEAAAVEEHAAL